MAAPTIQTILKPTRARGLDTSGSIQETYDIQTDGEFNSSDDTDWTTGTGVSITGGKVIVSDSGGSTGNALQGFNGITERGAGARGIKPGDKYRVQMVVEDPDSGGFDGKVRVILFSESPSGAGGDGYRANTSYVTSAGTLDEIVTVTTANVGVYNDAIVIENSDDPGSYKIASIKVTKLESFGNNNHAQIYSGRALEFDGATDSLTVPDNVLEGKDWRTGTIVTWIYLEADQTSNDRIFSSYTSDTTRFYILLTNTGILRHQLGDEDVYTDSNTALQLKTWYRIVITWNVDGTANIYINGVLDKASTGIDVSTLNAISMGGANNCSIGSHNGSSAFFDGKMSDFQMWDSTWTAADAEYDYINPEQLALNRGGTSLTNSNLKLWYPMNDGHRGNQSFILDASNTGLGDNLVAYNPGFESGSSSLTGDDDTGWQNNNVDGDDVSEVNTNSLYVKTGSNSWHIQEVGGASPTGIMQNCTITTNTITKVTAEVYVISGKATIDCRKGSSSGSNFVSPVENSTTGQWETLTQIFDSGSETSLNARLVTKNSQETEFYVDNISVQQINAKHNATTEFYGDNLLPGVTGAALGDFEDSDTTPTFTVHYSGGSGDGGTWDAANESDALNDVKDGKFTNDTGSGSSVAENAGIVSNGLDVVQGRTYEVSFKYATNYDVSTQTEKLTYKLGKTQSIGSTHINSGGGYDATSDLDATDSTTFTDTFIHTDSDTEIFLVLFGGDGLEFQIDDVYFKEVGTATGWTDADQQLDIPQTALQSYNQLAWFDNDNDYVPITYSVDDAQVSFSAWIFSVKAKANQIIVDARDGADDGYLFYVANADTDAPKLYFSLDSTDLNVSNKLKHGEWQHVVATYDGSNASLFLNGVLIGGPSAKTCDATNVSNNTTVIGSRYDGASSPFCGCITEVCIFNDDLSQAEVTELYNDGIALNALTHSASSELIGYWRNNGLATWTDLSGVSANGTPTNMTETMLITAGVDSSRDSQGFLMNRQRATNSLNLGYQNHASYHTFGKVLSESGAVDDGLSFLASGTGGGAMTITCWVKPQDAGNGTQQIISKNDNADGYRVQLNNSTPNVSFYREKTNGGNSFIGATSSTSLSNDTWYFIACSYDGATSSGVTKIYIGTSSSLTYETANSSGIDMDASAGNLHIGSHNGGGGNFVGEIDDICIYNKELTALEADGSAAEENDVITGGEINRNYKAGKRSHR